MQALIRLALVSVLLASLAPRAAAASPSDDLEKARVVFREGNYKDAILMLSPLLYPVPKLSKAVDLAQAHLMLGVSYFETGQEQDAAVEFEEALALDSSLRISTEASQPAAEFFETKKKELEKKEKEEAVARERARLRRRLAETPAVEKNQYWINFVPFGLGQLQNGDKGKAIFFFTSQAAMVATGFGIWFYLNRTYPDNRVPIEEVDAVRNLQFAGYVSNVLLVGFYAWGVIDAVRNYEPDVRRQLTEEEIEQLLRDEPEKSSLHIVPTLTPDGAGAALSWEF